MTLYVLYKNPIQPNTRKAVSYLAGLGYNVHPTIIVERNYPSWVTQVPSIETGTGDRFVGWDRCLQFWERETGVWGLHEKLARAADV